MVGMLLALASASEGGLLAQFWAAPMSAEPELQYVGFGPLAPALKDVAGSHGNGDGNLPVEQQIPGGLWLETPLVVPGPIEGMASILGGSTVFYDVSMELTGLAQNGPAELLGGLINQRLTSGTFALLSTTGTDPKPPTVLLSGVIDDAVITSTGLGQGGVLSASAHYSGGAIYSAAASKLGLNQGVVIDGELSWSLIDMKDLSAVVAPMVEMPQFQADAIGQFSYVPEPGVMGVVLVIGLMMRRRRA
jgi:hypothetical protein